MLQFIGVAILVIGVFFTVIGVWGAIRLPDVFTRLHASSKVSSIGILGLLIASALLLNETAPKAIALGILILFSAPVASQAIARSAYRDGCNIVGLVQNDLDVQYIDFAFNYTIGEEVPAGDSEEDNQLVTSSEE
jgi:multicomponent Na+:H+ antiporter subunit G